MTLAMIGFFVAALGTLVGVGGGFIFVPILLFLYPEQPHVWVVAVSMWLVAFNGASGAITYLRQRRVHLKVALTFILAATPGSILGVWLESLIERHVFEMIFGATMLLYSAYLFFKKPRREENNRVQTDTTFSRSLYLKGAIISFFVGFAAAFLGIGGGLAHVPLMIFALGFPVHLATGTSQFILAVTAFFTVLTHLWNGHFDVSESSLWALALGAIAGAQLGAFVSAQLSGRFILRILAVVVGAAGLKLLFGRIIW